MENPSPQATSLASLSTSSPSTKEPKREQAGKKEIANIKKHDNKKKSEMDNTSKALEENGPELFVDSADQKKKVAKEPEANI